MDDLISRQAAIDAIEKDWEKCSLMYEKSSIIFYTTRAIKELPSAQPEIIRCKDCCHRVEHKNYGNLGESAYTCESNMDGWILPDGYCNFAKRREDGKTD